MEFQLPDEVSQNIKAYFPRDKDKSSPTSPIMKSFIETVEKLTTLPPELACLEGDVNPNKSFTQKVVDVLDVLRDYGIRSDLSNLCCNLYIG